LNLKDFFARIWVKKKQLRAEEPLENRERQLRWMRARHEVSTNREFIEWLESLAIDYFLMGKQVKVNDPTFALMRAYYDGWFNTLVFIIEQVESSTNERIKLEIKDLEDRQKEMLTE